MMQRAKLIFAAGLGSVLIAGPAAAKEATADDRKIICKKLLETGSLVRQSKQCFTKAEWDRIAESQRTGAERLVHDLATKPAGGN